jgi:hypothetical protein
LWYDTASNSTDARANSTDARATDARATGPYSYSTHS